MRCACSKCPCKLPLHRRGFFAFCPPLACKLFLFCTIGLHSCSYCPNDGAPMNDTATPGCSLLINGTYYDNISVRCVLRMQRQLA